MAGCDGWITIKALELILSIFCTIYKRVTDDEANKLFYFLQKYSREWPLLNNIFWDENGSIFADVTYGGFVVITTGLIIGQATGELQHHVKTENFFLTMGALMFIAAGSLELAALDSVEERLVDNAAILGVISLLTGFVFILDLLLAGKRRKKIKLSNVKKRTIMKATQTEETKLAETQKSSDMNGNLQNGGHITNGEAFHKMDTKKIPTNGVKILPSSPVLENGVNHGVILAPPLYSPNELKSPEAKIRSTESFLRSEKGEYVRRIRGETQKEPLFIPPGYALVPVDMKKGDESKRDSGTPPGYASVVTENKSKPVKVPPGYVMVPVDPQHDDGSRKLQSPTVTTTLKSPNGYYHEESSLGRTPQPSLTNLSISDLSDADESKRKPNPEMMLKKPGNYSSEFLQAERKPRKYEDNEEGSKSLILTSPYPRSDSKMSYKSLIDFGHPSKGRSNPAFDGDFDGMPFKRNHSQRSSRLNMADKPKSILRFDRIRLSKKGENEDGADSRYDSLDSRKIAEDLRHLREITKSDLDLTQDLENENEILKRRLRREKEEVEKLKMDLQKQGSRKKLEERINELEDMERLIKLERKVRELEEKKLREDEKDRRMSEKEEQFFGIVDLRQSQRESSPVSRAKASEIEKSLRERRDGEGVKKVNENLKEKSFELEDKTRDDHEYRKVIDEGFYFLDEEEKRRRGRNKGKLTPEGYRKTAPDGKSPSPDGSDETQATDDEIRLRVSTPASSYKSEAQVWLGSDGDPRMKDSGPTSPGDPGFVLHTVQNWPETPSPSPQDRFRFSAKKAQKLRIGSVPKTPTPDSDDEDDRKKEVLTRRVDFTEVPIDDLERPATVLGSTSTWRKWLQPKPKFQATKSAPT